MVRILDVPVFDASDYLDTPEARAEYLTAVLEDGTDDEIRRALDVVAHAAGAADGPSEFAAVVRMMKSWGIGLSAAPLTPTE